jgi:hypothetical protein
MFDPFDPDREPMPMDDPAAHRKMRSVDGMKGSSHWYDNGRTQSVENPRWRQHLLVNEKGEIPLDKEKAVELARLHAPEYQTALERLYISAMDVSRERFAYDVQFVGNGGLTYADSGGGKSTWTDSARIGARRTLASGTEWVVDLANSVTWSLTGAGGTSWNPITTLNAGITQPLLRGAGRKVQLESLTLSERKFLEEVRRMVLTQQGHYTRVVTGSSPANIGVSGAGGGFYGLLSEQIKIQNRRQNIIGLEENLNRYYFLFEAGQQTDRYQVVEMEQRLLTSQSSLLRQVNAYQSAVESYIRSLGLPPDLRVSISDPLLEQFQLSSPTLTKLMEDVGEILAMIRKKEEPLSENFQERTKEFIRRTEGEMTIVEQDLQTLQKSMPARISGLKSLEALLAERIASGERIDPSIYDSKVFEDRIRKLQTEDIPLNLSRLRAIFTLLDLIANSDEQALREMIRERSFDEPARKALELLEISKADATKTDNEETADPPLEESQPETPKKPLREVDRIIAELLRKDDYRDWIRRVFSTFQYELVTLSLMQTRARLDAMTLTPVSITPEEAFRIASEHRLDWMNQKSQLVDTWRQIDIKANDLKGILDLELSGTLKTADINGVQFNKNNGSLSAGLVWNSPLNRYNQMLAYRRSQIDYQRARRDYYTYVDSVQAELRNIVRNVQMRQIDFEISRNAIWVDTIRVDIVQLRMDQPPQRGVGGRIDTNTSDQLIRALEGLMDSQNSFLDTWVAYQTQRMLLDFAMGTMTLDERGHWIDSGTLGSANGVSPQLAPQIPMPILEPPRLNRRYVEE